eukprot:TRINITY_DN2317_c1_g1_i2.p1 TRINITY_DN2317_c1_g1~~TRINITY_DN2317_c1_g1_i2.p1  ORF type:complete len:440 (+),score=142.41 TRINITY_DN2317_c1_g1_i2:580-1899(+)
MTPLDLVNRIMRKDNYLIAMINKDVLKMNIPMSHHVIVTKILEWTVSSTIFGFVFDPMNQDGINPHVKDPNKTRELAEGLRKRFKIMGLITLVLSPFIFIFLLIYFLFQYGEQLRSRPTTFATRQWSPLARWKLREFNELPHIFQRRLNASYQFADQYVNSFPINLVTIFARFLAFVIGSLLILFLALGFFDEDVLFKMEIWQKTPIWFIGVGGTILAACRSLIPDENSQIIEPEKAMENLVQFSHYFPSAWRGKVHTLKVLGEFTQLFEYKATIFAMEMMSVLFGPFILLYSLPKCADAIIAFFRDFTVNEPGVGDVCVFAVFPLEEFGNPKYGVQSNCLKSRSTRQGKMEKSFLSFKANYPEWNPGAQGEKYLASLGHSFHLEKDDMLTSVFNLNDHVMKSSPSSSRKNLRESIASLHKLHKQFYRSNPDQDDHLDF